jgi:hypothetical protein
MAIRNQQARILAPTAVSSTTTYYSSWMYIGDAVIAGALITNVGTSTGTITVELGYESADAGNPAVTAPTNYSAVSFQRNLATVASVSVAANTSYAIETGMVSATWFRVKYVNATNSGTITIDAVAKRFA